LSYDFLAFLRRESRCTPRHLWRAAAVAGSVVAWSQSARNVDRVRV
jgi:hypothetical protein